MENNNKDNETKDTIIGCGCFLMIVVVILAGVIGVFNLLKTNVKGSNTPKQSTEKHKIIHENKNSQNDISKDTFKGKWALTLSSAKIYCVNVGDMTGGKVKIEDKEYAITRNVNNLPFLTGNYWKNAPFEKIDQYNVCSDTTIGNECKVSLSDLVEYADNLCK